VSVIAVCPTPLVDSPDGVEGALVSTHAAVCVVTDVVGDTLPAASTAATPTEYDVPQVSPESR
jgi:hypothetical protein